MDTQREDHSCSVPSMLGIELGGRSRSGDTEERLTVWLYGSSVPATRPA